MRSTPLVPLLSLLLGCGGITPTEAENRLEAALTNTLAKRDLQHAVLHVHAPRLGIDATWAAGVADERTGAQMTADTPFLAASVGKLFVAATVIRLSQQGSLSLDDPLNRWLSAEQLQGLPVEGGDAVVGTITLAQLLGHQSGLPDYFDGKPEDDAATVLELIAHNPNRTWTTDELLDYTRAHFAPAGAPGEQFLYADTNYDLLGLVLESATGLSYEQVVTEQIIVPMGLSHTWYHRNNAPNGVGDYADVWVADVNVARYASLSADQAGGGLATTATDLRVFMRNLVEGNPVTLDDMSPEWTKNAISGGMDYGLGLWRIRPGRVFFTLGGLSEAQGASGATGSFVYYLPEHDAVVSGTFDDTDMVEGHLRFLLTHVLPTLNRLEP